MKRRTLCTTLAALAFIGATASDAYATDGHFLHGVGAINSALGGAGVASSSSILGAFYVNPAGLAAFTDTRVEIGFELFKPDRTIASTAGTFSGSTRSSSEFVPIPAFGWTRTVGNRGLVIGVAGLGAGGFGVDYHLDPANPILGPRPYGFGQVYSAFQLMKIVPAIALNVSPAFRLGFAANVDWASLAVDPMPVAAPAVDPGPDGTPGTADDRAYYSRATDGDGSFGIGLQAGVQWDVTGTVTLGLAYVSPQWFQKFQFGGVYENPNLPNYNMPRTITFAMDMPAIYSGGLALRLMDNMVWQADAKYYTYEQTRGFRESGFAADGAVKGFGWKNIFSYATGLEFAPVDQIVLRGGYNYSGNPIDDALTMFNAPAPAIVQHHATLGIGYRFSRGFAIDAAYYRAFENSISGPMQSPAGPMPGTSVESSMSENSFLVGFTYAPQGRR